MYTLYFLVTILLFFVCIHVPFLPQMEAKSLTTNDDNGFFSDSDDGEANDIFDEDDLALQAFQ